MRTSNRILLTVVVVGLASAAAWADGMIVPVRPDLRVSGAWAVKYHHVNIIVRDQVASVSIDQEFVNTGSGMIEVEYLFPVPPEAAIDSMTLVVNGKEYAAVLYKADEARKIYEEIVRIKKDPALLEYAGFGLYRTRAFPLQPGKPAKVIVTYKNLCKKDRGLVEVWYPLNTEKFSAKPIEDLEVKVDIKSKADITAVYSPSHDLVVDRKGARQVIATYAAKNELPATDFQVFYQAADEAVGAALLTYQPQASTYGYFMLLVSPNVRTASQSVMPKDIVLVFDHSGSMSGRLLEQAKAALRYVLKNLNRGDRFNVVSYSDSMDTFFDGLVPAEAKNVEEALDRVDRIEATGGTNIDEALTLAMKIVAGQQGQAAGRPKYILFMTDGQPTIGRTEVADILDDVRKANSDQARLLAFGVGYDVNTHLLDKLAEQNNGKSDYVKPKEPVDAKISSLYAKIKSPVMTNLKLDLRGIRFTDMYPRRIADLFEGDQLVLLGRYDLPEPAALAKTEDGYHSQLVVTGVYEGKEKAFEYPVTVRPAGRDSRYEFVPKLWAIRRVGFLLDEMQLHGRSKELMDELIRLSKEYGIITPYTSFLADERVAMKDSAGHKRALALAAQEQGREVAGRGGQMDAKVRQALREAENLAAPAGTRPAEGAVVFGNISAEKYDRGEAEVARNVRQVGNQAIYGRGNVWVAANAAHVDPERDKDKIREVQQFSREYFDLVRANTVAENQVLSQQRPNEELIISLRGQVYRIR